MKNTQPQLDQESKTAEPQNLNPYFANTPILVNSHTINCGMYQIAEAKARIIEKDKTIAHLQTCLKACNTVIDELLDDLSDLGDMLADDDSDDTDHSKSDNSKSSDASVAPELEEQAEQAKQDILRLKACNYDYKLTNIKLSLELLELKSRMNACQQNDEDSSLG
jgi:folylpolyglutamate synthase/dihydropteroate synthase